MKNIAKILAGEWGGKKRIQEVSKEVQNSGLEGVQWPSVHQQ